MTCELCTATGGELLWQDKWCRVVLIAEPGYAGYCRVIWNAHVAEMTDLDDDARAHCLRVVLTVESVLRELLAPDKVNLASLGNFTPHLHWHVIPRFRDDPHFPQAIWGQRQRDGAARRGNENLPASIAAKLSTRLK
jgi:diadenosine tetraphosphate (Ap4A) HIT family hydrolase